MSYDGLGNAIGGVIVALLSVVWVLIGTLIGCIAWIAFGLLLSWSEWVLAAIAWWYVGVFAYRRTA